MLRAFGPCAQAQVATVYFFAVKMFNQIVIARHLSGLAKSLKKSLVSSKKYNPERNHDKAHQNNHHDPVVAQQKGLNILLGKYLERPAGASCLFHIVINYFW